MTASDDRAAIILGAGAGERLGRGPKAFLELDGRPLVALSVDLVSEFCREVVVALPPPMVDNGRRLLDGRARVIPGGASRLATFRLLLRELGSSTVVLHDVVHPLTSRALVESVVQAAERAGAAAAVNRLNDFVLGADTVVQARPAMAYLQVKPIVFRVESIRLGLARVDAGHVLQGPGEPGVIELLRLAGDLPELVEAEPWNIKLTTERDWRMIQALEASGVPARRE